MLPLPLVIVRYLLMALIEDYTVDVGWLGWLCTIIKFAIAFKVAVFFPFSSPSCCSLHSCWSWRVNRVKTSKSCWLHNEKSLLNWIHKLRWSNWVNQPMAGLRREHRTAVPARQLTSSPGHMQFRVSPHIDDNGCNLSACTAYVERKRTPFQASDLNIATWTQVHGSTRLG